jgi:hypothetical protein
MDEVGRVVRIRCAVFLSGLPSDRKSVTKLCAFVSAAEQRFSRRLLLRQGAWGNRATVGGAAHQFAGRLQVAAQQIDSVCTRSIGYQLYYAYGFRMPENSSHADPAVHVPRE